MFFSTFSIMTLHYQQNLIRQFLFKFRIYIAFRSYFTFQNLHSLDGSAYRNCITIVIWVILKRVPTLLVNQCIVKKFGAENVQSLDYNAWSCYTFSVRDVINVDSQGWQIDCLPLGIDNMSSENNNLNSPPTVIKWSF